MKKLIQINDIKTNRKPYIYIYTEKMLNFSLFCYGL